LDLESLNVQEFRAISKVQALKIVTLDKKPIWKLRSQKDEQEIKKIKIAAKITKQAIVETIEELQIGLTELEVKQILENKIRQNLFCELAFPSIIAFDEHSTLPHHQSGNKKLENGSVVLIDAGAKYQQYCADMTRTIFFQTKSTSSKSNEADQEKIKQKKAEFEKILAIVQTAHDKAEALLASPSLTAADLDLACRNSIAEQTYGDHFIHTTGHGLGIDIHEPPSVYKTNPSKLLPGMVLTIEPGIYLPGKFGVRWENTVFYVGEK
jgi:Xaa-Pro aminopeptidase